MMNSVAALYNNGKLKFYENISIKRAKVLVTFIEEEKYVTFKSIPTSFKKPMHVEAIKHFSRDELHER